MVSPLRASSNTKKVDLLLLRVDASRHYAKVTEGMVERRLKRQSIQLKIDDGETRKMIHLPSIAVFV